MQKADPIALYGGLRGFIQHAKLTTEVGGWIPEIGIYSLGMCFYVKKRKKKNGVGRLVLHYDEGKKDRF